LDPEIVGKWVQALKEITPGIKQAAVLSQPGYELLARTAETVSPALGLEVTLALCQTAADVESAIAAVAGGTDRALIMIPGPLFIFRRGRRLDGVRYRYDRYFSPLGVLCRSHPQRGEAEQPAGSGADQVRAGY